LGFNQNVPRVYEPLGVPYATIHVLVFAFLRPLETYCFTSFHYWITIIYLLFYSIFYNLKMNLFGHLFGYVLFHERFTIKM